MHFLMIPCKSVYNYILEIHSFVERDLIKWLKANIDIFSIFSDKMLNIDGLSSIEHQPHVWYATQKEGDNP